MEPHQDPNEVRYALNRLVERLTVEYRDVRTDNPARFLEMRDLEWALRTALSTTLDWQFRFAKANRVVTRWDLEGNLNRRCLQSLPPGAPDCKTCGQPFATDADFWKHYIIDNLLYPNLGACWTKVRPDLAGSRPEWDPARVNGPAIPVSEEY